MSRRSSAKGMPTEPQLFAGAFHVLQHRPQPRCVVFDSTMNPPTKPGTSREDSSICNQIPDIVTFRTTHDDDDTIDRLNISTSLRSARLENLTFVIELEKKDTRISWTDVNLDLSDVELSQGIWKLRIMQRSLSAPTSSLTTWKVESASET